MSTLIFPIQNDETAPLHERTARFLVTHPHVLREMAFQLFKNRNSVYDDSAREAWDGLTAAERDAWCLEAQTVNEEYGRERHEEQERAAQPLRLLR